MHDPPSLAYTPRKSRWKKLFIKYPCMVLWRSIVLVGMVVLWLFFVSARISIPQSTNNNSCSIDERFEHAHHHEKACTYFNTWWKYFTTTVTECIECPCTMDNWNVVEDSSKNSKHQQDTLSIYPWWIHNYTMLTLILGRPFIFVSNPDDCKGVISVSQLLINT